tara:strand:- start:486 stop:722 length:237 start_codon:yes stop_codon:yes gene_type:complete
MDRLENQVPIGTLRERENRFNKLVFAISTIGIAGNNIEDFPSIAQYAQDLKDVGWYLFGRGMAMKLGYHIREGHENSL